MKNKNKIKSMIDEMSYSEMLYKWRFSPVGTTLFQGECGDYFAKVLSEKRNKLNSEEHSRISKMIGWDK